MAFSKIGFWWSLHQLGLNSALDFLKEDVKLMAVCVTTTGPRSKAAKAKTEEGSAREIWEWKRGERERGERG